MPVADVLRHCQHLVVFTGAGVSAESGIATFRDALTGLWERYDPALLATPEAFRRDPALVWGWYESRRLQVLEAQPNPAHLAIAELEKRLPKVTLITQNVDDLHERAGSTAVLHLHGSLHAPQCFACGRPVAVTGAATDEPDASGRIEPPRCKGCNGRARPGVVWFGEALPQQTMRSAMAAARECDCLLAIGTSGLVMPAAGIPALAVQRGATVIHINKQPVQTHADNEHVLLGTAGEVLPALLRSAFGTEK